MLGVQAYCCRGAAQASAHSDMPEAYANTHTYLETWLLSDPLRAAVCSACAVLARARLGRRSGERHQYGC